MTSPMADHDQSIAIIGSSCRFAGGASSPSKLWDLLQNPRDLSAPPPDTRFNLAGFYNPTAGHHGSTSIQGSYFLLDQDPRSFDAAFFNISPKEAEAIDPQHRMLLELTFEAMESAGLTIKGLQGSDTSVYVGLMIRDYMDIQARDPDYFSLYMVTGTSSALNANRLSYFFDWRGPSLTIDTACSSSLVAVHQAVQGLRSGESRIACVAGTNLLLGPELFISAGSMGMLSPRSRMWDERAEGYARGDGLAVFILKTLSNAIADGDHIEAIIRETGVNSDGRTKGITLPNPEAQATLIRETYRRAGLDISKAEGRPQYFEAHGTGTQAGDPMEASAIHKAFFGEDIQIDETDTKLWTGSIKTVVGHTEGTAGMAGMLKALLAMKYRAIPPNLHFHKLNPSVAPFYTHLQIPTEPVPWPEIALGTPLRVSVNSFGFGGTNAHIIMESYGSKAGSPLTQLKPQPGEKAFPVPLLISAHSEKALRSLVSDYSTYLKAHGESLSLRDLCYTLHSRRSDLSVKAFFSGMTVAGISQEMDGRLSAGTDLGYQSRGMVDARPCILGVFTGQGAQWPAMGKHLIENSRLFGETIDRLEKGLADLPNGPDWSLREEILAPKSRSRTAEATISQPLCAAIAIALVDLLHASGVTFSAVVGHSSGEIGAAYAAGVISATEAMQIAYYRGVYAELAEGKAGVKGAMLAIGLGFDDANDFCRQPLFAGRIEIAASNSPSSVTLSGDLEAIKEAKELLDSQKIFARKLQVDCAYHSHHMAPCGEPYVASLLSCNIQAKDPDAVDCTWISSVYGSEGAPGLSELGSTYWRDNMTQTVLFSQAIERAMIECGPFDVAIEIGPHPSLKGPVLQTVKEVLDDTIPYVGTLDRKENDIIAFGHSLASLWLQCGPGAVDFKNYVAVSEPEGLPPPALVKEHLPTYPWDHSQLFWRESRLSREYRLRNGPSHELLGHSMPGGDHEDGLRWRNILHPDEVPWIGNVRFQGSILLPVSVFCAMALETALKLVALAEIKADVGIAEIRSLEIFEAVSVPHGVAGVELITSIQKLQTDEIDALASAEFAVLFGPPDGSKPLKRAVSARVVLFPNGVSSEDPPEETPQDNGDDCLDVGEFYASISEMGLEYTGPFQTLQKIDRGWRRSSAIFSEKRNANTTCLAVNPFLFESCVQVAYAAFASPGDTSLWNGFLPRSLKKLTVHLDALSKCEDSLHKINGQITDATGPNALSGPGFNAEIEVLDNSCGHTLIELEELKFSSSNAALKGHDREVFLQTIWKRDVADAFQFPDDHGRLGEAMKSCQALEEKASQLNFLLSNSASCSANSSLNNTSSTSCFVMEKLVQQGAAQLTAIDNACSTSVAELLNCLARGDLRNFVEQHPVLAFLSSAVHDFLDLLSHRFAQLNILEIGPSSLGPSRHGIEGFGRLFSSYTFAGTTAGEVERHSDDIRYTSLETLSPETIMAILQDQKFDLVIASYALHGQTSNFMEKAVSGLRAIIKSGGYLLLIEPTMEYSWSRSFLNILLANSDDNAGSRAIGRPLSTVHLDQLLRKSDFSGIDSLLPSTDDDGPGSAISLIITQALDERIDLYRRPLQPSVMSLVDDSRLLVVGGKTLRTHKAIQNIVLVLRHWTRKINIVDSFDDFSLDSSLDYGGAIVLTDMDRPFVESLTSQAHDAVLKVFGQLSHILWVTSDALTKAPEQAASLGLCRSLSEEHPSVHLRFLDIDTLWGSEEKILSNFFRLLISNLPVSAFDERLYTDESWIVIRDGHAFIPRILPVQDMNDRLNSQRRIVKEEIPRGTPLVVIPCGSLDAATYQSQIFRSASIDSIHFSHSLPCAIKVYEDTYLYLFTGYTDAGGTMLGFSEALSLPGSASAVWKTCEPTGIPSDKFLGFAASLITAQTICSILPTGHSVILEPSQILASMILELTKGTEKEVCFVSTGAVKPAVEPWVIIPAHASKRAITSNLPDETKLFFNASSCSGRLVSKILENLPADTMIYDQSHIFSLGARTSRGVDTTLLEEVLCKLGSSALDAAHRMTDDVMLPRISVSDLVLADGIPRSYSGLSIIDWTRDTPISATVESLCPATLLSSSKTYVLVDIETQLLQSITCWLSSHGVRKLILIDKSNVEWSGQKLPLKVSVQFIKLDLTNSSEIHKLMFKLPDVVGVIYGGAGAHRSFRDEQGDTLRIWRNVIQGSRNLSEALITQNPDFFIILSSEPKNHAPVSAYLASLASQARVRGLAACLIDLSALWAVSEKSNNDSLYMRISESDLHYVLTEAISAAQLKRHDPVILAGMRRIRKVDAEIASHTKWLSQPIFSHLVIHSSISVAAGDEVKAQSLQKRLSLCRDHKMASLAIQDFLLAELAVTLNLPPGRIQSKSDMSSLGVDSLTASSIRAWFLKEVGVDAPIFKILGGASISQLCDEVAAGMTFDAAKEEAIPVRPVATTAKETSAFPPVEMTIAQLGEQILQSAREPILQYADAPVSEELSSASNTETMITPVSDNVSHAVESDYFGNPKSMKQSLNQARLWFPSIYLDQQTPFNCTTSYTLTGPIDGASLHTAFQLLIQRHESFRTSFYNDEVTGESRQHILQSSPFALKVMMGNKTEDYKREFRRIHEYHFDLLKADTFIATLVSHSPTEHTIITGYHHIIMDGVSWQITLNEVARFYDYDTPELPPLSQYIDFAIRQQQLIADNCHAQRLAYWKMEFPTPPVLTPLFPFAKVGTRKTLTRYDTVDVVLDVNALLVAKIKKATLSAKSTSFYFYLAAFVVLMNRCLDVDEVCLGIVDANRSDKEFLSTIGFFIDMLPLKLKVNKKERFQHTIENARKKVYRALEHSGVPFECILKELQIPASSNHTPMFQVLLNYRMGALRAPQMGEAKMTFLNYEDAKAPFDLTLSIDEKDDGTGMLTFSMQEYLYDHAGAELLVSTYVHLLDTLSDDPSQRLNSISLYSKAVSDRVLTIGTGPIIDFEWPRVQTISQRVDWQTQQHPNGLAVKDLNGKSRTYLQISKRVHALALALAKSNISYGCRVAVYCEPSVDYIACILSVHRVGATFIPLDARNSPDRLRAVVQECAPTLVLYDSSTRGRCPGFVPSEQATMDISTVDETTDALVSNVSRLSDDAFILYTSGSTGKPKGISLTQANIAIHCASVLDKLGIRHQDVFLQQSALGFDAALGQMLYAFANGATLILGDNRGDPRDLAVLMENEGVTLTLFIISEVSALLQHASDILSRCVCWRGALCGGEAFTGRLLSQFRKLGLSDLVLYNAYGPTEGCIITSIGMIPYRDVSLTEDVKVPCGPPLPNYGVYILDKNFQPVPLGWPGEICISGPCIASGYVGQPSMTATKFKPDHLQRPAGPRYEGWNAIYRTGDRARMLEDGSFIFLGRIDGDSQVKLRGVRIELGEITSAIIMASKGAISDAATILRGIEVQTLVSFIVFSSDYTERLGGDLSPKDFLRKLVHELPLPVYMRPAVAIPLDSLPINERGKLDTKALAAHRFEEAVEDIDDLWTETEQKLKRVWQSVLPEQDLALQITKQSDFFSVGGNSLLLIHLRAAINNTFGIKIPLSDLFQASTLEYLAARLENPSASHGKEEIDWDVEVALDSSLPAASACRTLANDVTEAQPITVILTGSTGFLGREIARQLMVNPLIARIHCVAVRPGRAPPASEKLVIHRGDLTRPLLGLRDSVAREIFSTAFAIIHNGAEVSHMKTYRSMRMANVGSTKELVSLALRVAQEVGVPVPSFHYISTIGVGSLVGALEFREESISSYPPAEDGSNGYIATKFASECFLEHASKKLGLPVTIHRPSNISGSGVQDQDIVHSVWRWSESLHAVPDLAAAGAVGAFDFISVEKCAAGIISSVLDGLNLAAGNSVRYIHQSGGEIIPFESLKETMEKRLETSVALLPFDEWIGKAVDMGLDELVISFLKQTKGAFFMPWCVKKQAVGSGVDAM